MQLKNCKLCASCQLRNRWEAQYQQFLKDNPTKQAEEFIARMRKIDKTLFCFHQDTVDKGYVVKDGFMVVTDMDLFQKSEEYEEWRDRGGWWI